MDKIKMLLGITDDAQNELLQFLLDEVRDMICGYCRIDDVPTKLESLIPIIAADLYRRKGYGSAETPQIVSGITEGDRSITYSKTEKENADVLESYYARLNPFRNRRGRVPSEYTGI